MRAWKMAGSLALLVLMICGCIAIGKSTEVSAETAPPTGVETPAPDEPDDGGGVGEGDAGEKPADGGENGTSDVTNSTTVEKTYSEGLSFRSNGDGTCAVAGLGSCTSACVLIPPKSPAGDTVTEILPYAFRDSVVGAVEIPATVKTLSALSFAGAVRLGIIQLAEGSPYFLVEDGVLYTLGGDTLICCPAGRTAESLSLHGALTRVAAGAFSECAALKTVSFKGTVSAWHNVIVGDGNEALFAAGFTFSS